MKSQLPFITVARHPTLCKGKEIVPLITVEQHWVTPPRTVYSSFRFISCSFLLIVQVRYLRMDRLVLVKHSPWKEFGLNLNYVESFLIHLHMSSATLPNLLATLVFWFVHKISIFSACI